MGMCISISNQVFSLDGSALIDFFFFFFGHYQVIDPNTQLIKYFKNMETVMKRKLEAQTKKLLCRAVYLFTFFFFFQKLKIIIIILRIYIYIYIYIFF
jgi:hypothetical protein